MSKNARDHIKILKYLNSFQFLIYIIPDNGIKSETLNFQYFLYRIIIKCDICPIFV